MKYGNYDSYVVTIIATYSMSLFYVASRANVNITIKNNNIIIKLYIFVMYDGLYYTRQLLVGL